jgi:hypothetical protein
MKRATGDQLRGSLRPRLVGRAAVGALVALAAFLIAVGVGAAATGARTDAAPVSSVSPTISGIPREGRLLTVSSGSWTGSAPIVFAYQWKRCDTTGAGCAAIPGATTQTYVLTSTDVGHTIRVTVTATNSVGAASVITDATGVVAVLDAPLNTSLPTIAGTARDGEKLTAAAGSWSGANTIKYAYRWMRCDQGGSACASISGATAQEYVLKVDDVGHTLRVVVTATNAVGQESATSGPSALVAAKGTAPASISQPVLSGNAQEGTTLSTSNGSWGGTSPITYRYSWERCDTSGKKCALIPGANSAKYTLTAADVGHTLRSIVTASNNAGASTSYSRTTATVTPRGPLNKGLPKISGTPRAGQTLTATTGSWTAAGKVTYSYQWARCDAKGQKCAPITGAVSSRYTLTSADVGHMLIVQVKAQNASGYGFANSAPTTVVGAAKAPSSTARPTISGTARAGQTLTAATGSWAVSGAKPTYYFQWARCDAKGMNCAPIAGAVSSRYTLTGADVGHMLIVQVKAQNADGAGYADSRPTAVVAPSAATVSLRASRKTVLYGAFTRLSGTISSGQAGQQVQIVVRRAGTTGSSTINTVTTKGGAFNVEVQPTVQTTYQATMGGVASGSMTVYVRPRLRLGRVGAKTVSLRVHEAGSLAGRFALVQYWSAPRHRWRTLVARVQLRSTGLGIRPTVVSSATFKVGKLKAGTKIRAFLSSGQAGSGYLSGTSNTITF